MNDDHCDCASGADEPGTSGEHSFRAHFFFRPHLSRALLSIFFVCIPAFTDFLSNVDDDFEVCLYSFLESFVRRFFTLFAACGNGKFFCHNRGFKGQHLHSSAVCLFVCLSVLVVIGEKTLWQL